MASVPYSAEPVRHVPDLATVAAPFDTLVYSVNFEPNNLHVDHSRGDRYPALCAAYVTPTSRPSRSASCGYIGSHTAGSVQHDLCPGRTAALDLKDDRVASEVFEYEFLTVRV